MSAAEAETDLLRKRRAEEGAGGGLRRSVRPRVEACNALLQPPLSGGGSGPLRSTALLPAPSARLGGGCEGHSTHAAAALLEVQLRGGFCGVHGGGVVGVGGDAPPFPQGSAFPLCEGIGGKAPAAECGAAARAARPVTLPMAVSAAALAVKQHAAWAAVRERLFGGGGGSGGGGGAALPSAPSPHTADAADAPAGALSSRGSSSSGDPHPLTVTVTLVVSPPPLPGGLLGSAAASAHARGWAAHFCAAFADHYARAFAAAALRAHVAAMEAYAAEYLASATAHELGAFFVNAARLYRADVDAAAAAACVLGAAAAGGADGGGGGSGCSAPPAREETPLSARRLERVGALLAAAGTEVAAPGASGPHAPAPHTDDTPPGVATPALVAAARAGQVFPSSLPTPGAMAALVDAVAKTAACTLPAHAQPAPGAGAARWVHCTLERVGGGCGGMGGGGGGGAPSRSPRIVAALSPGRGAFPTPPPPPSARFAAALRALLPQEGSARLPEPPAPSRTP
jgi:hypothetical protein